MSSSPPPASDRAPLPSRGWSAHLVRASALASLLLISPAPFGQASAARMPPSSPSTPKAPASLHQEILRLLESPESLPREADWAPLGPEALTELSGLAGNPDAPEPQRTRAVAAMAVVSHPEASQRLQQLLRSSEAPPSLRAAATVALGRRAGLEAVPLLMPLLEDRSEQVRATAAQALGRMGGAEARKVLEERLPVEESLEVREAIQRGLSYIEP
ncbi:HEAT repeat domain-containing protein [Archangium violaceum]|uniref:HEAT repeat domain-containing protein n=1 Tax=Archangium violaceum TaxID=83451 RepID=UPI00195230E6|nr:HEAT repeat domain-containing protein [Archangium violaceum]QRN93795.1 HEAT repeat domain-containing protein [Archangium violaceum]